jgi:DNA-binding transcriptional regulator GbsR (MarR family)
LSLIKEELEKSRDVIEKASSDMKSSKDSMLEMKENVSNIEKEFDWWSDKNTLATQLLKRLDAIERK